MDHFGAQHVNIGISGGAVDLEGQAKPENCI
jgi:hypothetical protein